jgi:predicted nucleic acid-binding protein
MKYVVDASFIASLFLPDETSEKSAALAKKIAKDGAAAPALWQLEVTNLLLMAERRNRIDAGQLTRLLDAIDAVPIQLQPALTSKQRGDVVQLARKRQLTAYDAAYLELAVRLNLILASLDDALIRAAKAEGVKLGV